MANVGFDGRTRNDENIQDIPLRSKQMNSNEGRSIKKQIFGELKNVMQNQQIGATPIKGNAAKIDGLPGKFGASYSLCNDVLRKQQLKQNFLDAQKKLEQKYKTDVAVETYKEPVFDEELFDSWDYGRKCCHQQKREEEIWADMDFDRIDFDGKIFHCAVDEDGSNARPEDPALFDDLDHSLSISAYDSIIEPELSSICEMPSVLDCYEHFEYCDDLA